MTAKAYFKRVYEVDAEIKALNAQHAHYFELVTPLHLDETCGVDTAVAEMIDLEKQIVEKRREYGREQLKAWGVIEKLSDAQMRLVMKYRYLCAKDWKEVAAILGYSLRHVYRLHGDALQEAEKILAVNVH